MYSIKINILANLIGKVWGALITIILLPVYIKYLGIESYGLVGFYTTLIGSIAILDFGLSITLNRELAKFESENRSVEDIRNLTFSLECVYWAIGVIICIGIILLSPVIATHWINTEHISVNVVKQSVILMGIVVAFQWPISLYMGGLTGLERQVLNNVITIIMSTLRAIGVIILFKYVSASIQAFFLWQAMATMLYVLSMRWGLWEKMPSSKAILKFSSKQLKIIWRFTVGMTGIGVVTFLLSQIDKIVLSKILPLSQFGYYTLAFTIANSIALVAGPVSITYFPKLTNLIANNNYEELREKYHQSCRFTATLIFPFCFVIIFFTQDVLRIIVKNPDVTEHAYLLVRILVIGSGLNALMIMPYNLLIAQGWTRFTIYQNLIAGVILVPLLFYLTHKYGTFGASFVWLIVNAGYVIISQPLMHRKLLKGELVKWYWRDTFLPMLPSLVVILMVKFCFKYFLPECKPNLILLGIIGLISLTCSIIYLEEGRDYLRKLKFNFYGL